MHGAPSREEVLERADDLDAAAAHAEKMRAGFSSAIWIAEGMLRDGQYRQDEAAVDEARVNVRNARRFTDQTAKQRDACAAGSAVLRESLGDYIPATALSADYRLRYASAASVYATTATLIYLGQDSTTLVAAEASATWEARNPGHSFHTELTRIAGLA